MDTKIEHRLYLFEMPKNAPWPPHSFHYHRGSEHICNTEVQTHLVQMFDQNMYKRHD